MFCTVFLFIFIKVMLIVWCNMSFMGQHQCVSKIIVKKECSHALEFFMNVQWNVTKRLIFRQNSIVTSVGSRMVLDLELGLKLTSAFG